MAFENYIPGKPRLETVRNNRSSHQFQGLAIGLNNKGTSTAIIDGQLELKPGESISFDAIKDHAYSYTADVEFTGGGDNRLLIVSYIPTPANQNC